METAFTIEGLTIKVQGIIDGNVADSIAEAMTMENAYFIDFNDVEDIKFSGLRSLLRNSQKGYKFCIINTASNVAERFEDTGVSTFVNVCRKPKPLKLASYDEFGGGYASKSFNSEDGDSMLKVYCKGDLRELTIREKLNARAVMQFGIPTPLVGSLYEEGDNTGLDFERITGKKSLSRIISEQPERLKEITVLFANMCKELHAKECDVKLFPDRRTSYRNTVITCDAITESEKQKALAFIDQIPSATTCLHGDMQLSNVITNGKDTLWIDLADFGYGNPLLDMGMWYFLSVLNTEALCQHIFHLSKQQMTEIWDIFIEVYYGATTAAQKQEVVRQVEPYAALHMIYIGTVYGFEPGLIAYIKEKLLK